MQATTNRDALRNAVRTALRAVPARPVLPVLGSLLVDLRPKEVSVEACDLEVSIRVEIPVEASGTARLLVPARTLAGIVEAAPHGDITLEADPEAGRLHVAAGGTEYDLVTGNPEDFPEMPDTPHHLFSIGAATLVDLLRRTAFAAARDDTRPGMTGVMLELEGSKLSAVATDGVRLALGSIPLGSAASGRWVIPRRTAVHLTAILAGIDSEVSVFVAPDRGGISFAAPGVRVHSRLLVASFPDYRQVLDRRSRGRVLLDASELRDALARVSIPTDIVRIGLRPDTVVLESSATDLGNARTTVSARVEGELLTTALNARLLLDALTSGLDGQIACDFGDELTPIVFRPQDGKDYSYVLAPVRIQV
jgi:DNA polymerase-3 subunit beta